MHTLFSRGAGLILTLAVFVGCDRMITPRSAQLIRDARRKATEGEFMAAINLYENALDGSAESADVHYQMALLYDDKMKEPLHALHHFKRYLTLAPNGPHAAQVKDLMKRDELELITDSAGDSVLTRGEAGRLRNENLTLRKKLEERVAAPRAPGNANKTAAKKGEPAPPRTHVVQTGDTLFSLSRQYYNSPDRWKDILRANKKNVDDPGKLKVGQTLTIP
ncbi:MAG: LysM peptidoglycan-binding domain-containing protein [Chthoniobacterales bacterium]